MLARRSTLLVYSIGSPFGSFIDFFSPRYENSFEWPDGTRGLLKADERVYFSLIENPKWRPRYENTHRMVVHGKRIKFEEAGRRPRKQADGEERRARCGYLKLGGAPPVRHVPARNVRDRPTFSQGDADGTVSTVRIAAFGLTREEKESTARTRAAN